MPLSALFLEEAATSCLTLGLALVKRLTKSNSELVIVPWADFFYKYSQSRTSATLQQIHENKTLVSGKAYLVQGLLFKKKQIKGEHKEQTLLMLRKLAGGASP